MEKLSKTEGQYYITQTGAAPGDSSIFSKAMVMRTGDFRVATEDEIRVRRGHEESRERMANEIIQEQ